MRTLLTGNTLAVDSGYVALYRCLVSLRNS